MIQKLLVFVVAIAANMAVVWFANKGAGLVGLSGATIHTLKFFWLLLIVNIAFAYAGQIGITVFGSTLAFMLVWMAAAPIATLTFSYFAKEPINYIHIVGLIFIFGGSLLISANKEILDYLR